MSATVYGSLPPSTKTVATRKRTQRKNAGSESLVDTCARVVASNFSTMPFLDRVPPRHQDKVIRRLPTDLDLTVAAAYVHSESYWKRCCIEGKGWNDCEILKHGFSWKQTFFERNLQEALEDYDEDRNSNEELIATIKASKDYVFSLTITQLLTHPDLAMLFDNLHNLSSLTLTYGVKRLRLRYNRTLFGMKLSDAESLASCLKTTTTLCHLSLTSNIIDDDNLEVLMSGLAENCTVTSLDLSHNKITDLGVQILSDILGKNSVLSSLDLCNNQIQSEGGRVLGHLLSENQSLTSLNLRLNRLGDIGAGAIFRALSYNDTLTHCNVSGNLIGLDAIKTLATSMRERKFCLKWLDLSANELNDEAADLLQSALEKNTTLTGLDMRANRLTKGSSAISEINSLLRRNERRSATTRGESKGK